MVSDPKLQLSPKKNDVRVCVCVCIYIYIYISVSSCSRGSGFGVVETMLGFVTTSREK